MEIPLKLKSIPKHSKDYEILGETEKLRKSAHELAATGRYRDAVERITEALRRAREFSDYAHVEFRARLSELLFDLAVMHYELKDYRQSEKEVEILHSVLQSLSEHDPERFGTCHIQAMELSTLILRSRRKMMELLAKSRIAAGQLYEKVNSGITSATDKLVDALRRVAQLQAGTGNYSEALKFYTEAIKLSKRRSGKVTAKEIDMTIEMAGIMRNLKRMQPRARRLLEAVLPHAIAAGDIKQEADILALIELIEADIENEPKWRNFLSKLNIASKIRSKDN